MTRNQRTRSSGRITLLLAIISLMAMRSVAWGQFPITKIADVSTPYPDGGGTFAFFTVPSLDHSDLAFAAVSTVGGDGIFRNTGGVFQLVADETVAIPGGSGTFTGIGSVPSISGGKVAFDGRGADQQRGIYLFSENLEVVADRDTQVPGQVPGTTFEWLNRPHISSETVVFGGSYLINNAIYDGVYRSDSTGLSTVAAPGMTLPGGDIILGAAFPLVSSDRIVFAAFSTTRTGLFAQTAAGTETIVDTLTQIPGTQEFFTGFHQMNIDGEDAAFLGSGSDAGHCLCVIREENLTLVAGPTTPIPDGTGTFTGFFDAGMGAPGLSNGGVAFSAFGADQQHGIYYHDGSSLMKVIDRNTLLDGQEVLYFLVGRDSLEGNQLAFAAVFHDMTGALYIATVPEPSVALLTMLAFAWLPRWRRAGR